MQQRSGTDSLTDTLVRNIAAFTEIVCKAKEAEEIPKMTRKGLQERNAEIMDQYEKKSVNSTARNGKV